MNFLANPVISYVVRLLTQHECALTKRGRDMRIVRISCEHEGKDGVICPFTKDTQDGQQTPS